MSARALLLVASAAAVLGLGAAALMHPVDPPPEARPAPSAELTLPTVSAAPLRIRHRVREGETLAAILGPWGIDAHALRRDALGHHDLSRLREGRSLWLFVDEDAQKVGELRYELSEDELLVAIEEGGTWTVRVEALPYAAQLDRLSFEVRSSLWEAATQAGLRPPDILEIVRIFESEVDFNTEVHAGARFELVAHRLRREDGFEKLGPLLALRMTNGGKVRVATRFQPPGESADHYDDEGVAQRGTFLRSPLPFTQVTSGFSRGRFHPILKVRRPHTGTDFGAPSGTPVRAVASGTVVRAGYNGGHGNYIEIQHDGRYRTSYSHLSRIQVRKGEKVAQGQGIGAVGSTGMSTGPHLHFQLWVDGKLTDPMSTVIPRVKRLDPSQMAAFAQERDRLRAWLDGAPLDEGG